MTYPIHPGTYLRTAANWVSCQTHSFWLENAVQCRRLPKYQTRNSRWHPKFNSSNCNKYFVKLQRTQSLPRPTTHAAISTFSTSHNSISSQYSQPFTSLAAPKAKSIVHAANKTYSYNISTIAILLLHPSFNT